MRSRIGEIDFVRSLFTPSQIGLAAFLTFFGDTL